MARPASLRIRLLGPLEVEVAGRPIVVDTRKALAIVALVAAEARPFARDELAAMFWPDATDEAARGALRRTLSTLRSAIGDVGLRIERTRVLIETRRVWVDLAELERLASSTSAEDLEAAVALARGPVLAGFAIRDSPTFDDWQAALASRVEAMVGQLLDRVALRRLAVGDSSGAVDAARRRVELDPLDESGQRRLIEMLGRTGDRAGAIGRYRALVALFDQELGVAPLQVTTAVYDAIRDGEFEGSPSTRRDATGGPASTMLGSASGADRPDVTPAAPLPLPLVGREVELAQLLGAWHAAGPDGRLAVVEGEGGMGKTRLAEELADIVRSAGGVVLSSRGHAGESAIAYGPIAELLRAGVAIPGGHERLGLLDETVRLEIGRLVDLPASIRVATPVTIDRPGAQVRLLDSVAQTLTGLTAGPIPGLIRIDDFHLVDGPTREAVTYLARRLAARPLLVLLAWRREDLTRESLATADDLVERSGATVVSLAPFDRTAIARLVSLARPDAVDDGTADGLTDQLAADSEGLPLHVVEALARRDDPSRGPAALPRGVEAILRERIASVSETAGQILAAAAVIGRSFDLSIVRRASGRSEEETIGALEELTRRGLVREVPDGAVGAVRYDFRHGRLRDAAYAATSLARRRLLHRRTAEAIRDDAVGAGRDDSARFALIAAHEREAGRPAEAAVAHREAADRAEAVYANREAIGHLEAAIALGLPDPAAAWARIAELRSRLAEYPAAVAALETAAALAVPGALPGIEVALGRVHRRRGDLVAASSHLAAALSSPDLPPILRQRALVERSLVALRGGDLETAKQSSLGAREAADRAGDPHAMGVAERLVGLVAQASGDRTGARRALARSLVLAADDPDPTALIAASAALALTLASDGAVEDAVATAETAIEVCRRIGDRHLEAAVENHLADLLHGVGRDDEAMIHLKSAAALFAEIGEGEPEREPGIWSLAAW